MYIRLIDSTLRENEYLFRLNDQQKVYYIRSGLPQFPGNHLHLQKNLFTLTCKNLGSYVQGSTVEKM